MSQRSPLPESTDPLPAWQAHLAVVARALPYPLTPKLSPGVLRQTSLVARYVPHAARRVSPLTARRLTYALTLALILAAALLAVPGVRAGLLEFLQLGAVRIRLVPSPSPTPVPTATGTPPPPTRPPAPSPTPLGSVLDLAGETTLAEARDQVAYPIRLPAYPADLGEPDRVFLQDLDGLSVVLVWLEPGSATDVRLSVQILASPRMADKLFFDVVKNQPPSVELTTVNDTDALWTTGPYVLITRLGDLEETRLVDGHALIWVEGELTYRLETKLDMEEAVRMAESLEE